MKYFYIIFITGLLSPYLAMGQWQHLGSGTTPPTNSKPAVTTLSVVDTNVIWARATVPGRYFVRTADGGQTWQADTIFHDNNYYTDHLSALNADTAWYSLTHVNSDARSKIFRTNNGGQTWTEQAGPFNNLTHAAKRVHFFDKNIGIAFGNSNTGTSSDVLRIYRTTNGGTTWTTLSSTALPSSVTGEKIISSGLNTIGGNNLHDAVGDTLWFGTTKTRIWRTTNKGQSWTAVQLGPLACPIIGSIQFSNHLNGIAIPCNSTSAFKTTNGGTTWSSLSLPFPARVIEYVPGTSGTYIIAPAFATIAHLAITRNNGVSWQNLNFSYPIYMFSTVFLSPTLGFGGSFIAGPDSGGVFKWIGDLTKGNPICTSCQTNIDTFPHRETFDGNGGSWCESSTDNTNWTLNTGSTATANTGPNGAKKGDYYLFLESSFPYNPNVFSDIISPCYDLRSSCIGGASFRFSYNMNGSSMGSLRISVSTNKGVAWQSPIWSKNGHQGTAWKTDSIDLSSFVGQIIRLRITGTTGTSFTSDIAIDELEFRTSSSLAVSATISEGCKGDSTGSILTAVTGGTSPYAFSWSTGDTTAGINNLWPASYQVIISDSNGCTTHATYTIQEPPALVVTAVGTPVTCFGNANGMANAMATGGTSPYVYSWSNGDTTSSISNLGPGKYSITLTDTNGCISIDSTEISEPAILLANPVVTNVSCPGDSNGSIILIPSGGTPPYAVSWTSGSTDSARYHLTSGPYNYILTDHNNCIKGGGVSIQQPDSISGDFLVNDVTCYGDSTGRIVVIPSGGNGGYVYQWSNGAQTDTVSGLGVGRYSILLTDSLGCSWQDSTEILQPDSLSISALIVQDTLGMMTGGIDLTIQGGTMPYTFRWNTGDSTQNLGNLSGNNRYTVQVIDANGCTHLDSFFIQTTALEDENGHSIVQVYPNPTRAGLNIRFTAGITSDITFKVYDLQGRLLWQRKKKLTGQEDVTALDVKFLPGGVYYLYIESEKGRKKVKWIKR